MNELKWQSEHLCFLPPDHETDRPVLAAVIGQRSTLVIDAGNSVSHARKFITLLESEGIQADWVAITHFHWDHTFGMAAFDARIVTQEGTREKLGEMSGLSWTDEAIDQRVRKGEEAVFCADYIKKEFAPGDREIVLPFPDVVFRDEVIIDLGGISCHLRHIGGDHIPDSSVVYVPELKLLHCGDALYPDIMDWSNTTEKTLCIVQRLEGLEVETCILSHRETTMNEEEFRNELTLLKRISLLIREFQGVRDSIVAELERQFERTLTEDELERVGYFCNGYARVTNQR